MTENLKSYPSGYPTATAEKLNAKGPVKYWRFFTPSGGIYDLLRFRHGNEKDGMTTAWRLVRNTDRITKLYPKTVLSALVFGVGFWWLNTTIHYDETRYDLERQARREREAERETAYYKGYDAGVAHVAGNISKHEAGQYRPLITYLHGQRRKAADEAEAKRLREELTKTFPEVVPKAN